MTRQQSSTGLYYFLGSILTKQARKHYIRVKQLLGSKLSMVLQPKRNTNSTIKCKKSFQVTENKQRATVMPNCQCQTHCIGPKTYRVIPCHDLAVSVLGKPATYNQSPSILTRGLRTFASCRITAGLIQTVNLICDHIENK